MQLVNLYGPDDFRLEEVAQPVAGADDMVVKVAACGICGSDVGYVAQGGLAGPTDSAMPLGHELAGTVHEFGTNVSGFDIGDRVVVNPMGANNQIGNGGSEGGFADYLLVKNASAGESVYKIPATLSFAQGALVEPLSVAMHAVNRARPVPGEKAVVFGVGAIGLGSIVCLRRMGITNIVAVDLSQQRLQRAQQLGATATVSPEHGDLFGYIATQQGETDFLGFMPVWDTDIFIDAAGAAPVIKTVLDSCKTGARLVVAGLHKKPVEVDLMLLLSKELSLLGSMAYPDEFPEVIAMLEDSAIDVSPMISHRFPLAQFSNAFAIAQSPAAGAKVIIEID